jgi:hypothetical protein
MVCRDAINKSPLCDDGDGAKTQDKNKLNFNGISRIRGSSIAAAENLLKLHIFND